MGWAIINEDDYEAAAIRIGQLKHAIPGTPEAEELKANIQALVHYEKQNCCNAPPLALGKEADHNLESDSHPPA